MPVKLFIVGLPGSGKSVMARHIEKFVSDQSKLDARSNWFTTRFNDYPILHTLFTDDKEGKRFEPAVPGGFNVLDFNIFDDALKFLGNWITWHITSKQAKPQELLLIEFARNDYRRAFDQFKRELLQDAYFIYLGTDIKVCQQRIHERVVNPENEKDDYPVSDRIFETYYHSDNGDRFLDILAQEIGIARQHVVVLDNNGSLDDAKKAVQAFVVHILEQGICDSSDLIQTDKLGSPVPV